MKIEIGPYKNWFGPYQLAEKLFFFTQYRNEDGLKEFPDWVDDFGELLAYGSIQKEEKHFRINNDRKPTLLFRFLQWIDSKKKRNVKIKINNYDLWNVDWTLAIIILPLLKEFKKLGNSYPLVDDCDVPTELKSTSCIKPEDEHYFDSNAENRWNWVMEEMIWTFEQLQPDYDYEAQYYSGESDLYFERIEGTEYSELKHSPNDTFKINREGLQKHKERINNGLRLFGKYFRSLWS